VYGLTRGGQKKRKGKKGGEERSKGRTPILENSFGAEHHRGLAIFSPTHAQRATITKKTAKGEVRGISSAEPENIRNRKGTKGGMDKVAGAKVDGR